MGQLELFNHLLRIIIPGFLKSSNCVQIIYITSEYLMELLMLKGSTWNHLTVYKWLILDRIISVW